MSAEWKLNRRDLLGAGAVAVSSVLSGRGFAFESGSFVLEPDKDLIPAPRDPAMWPQFRQQLTQWRDQARKQLHYDDALYRRPEFAWASSSYCCCFLMMCDEAFYDTASGRYTVDAFLDDGAERFGGYDSIVLWHAYPRIGVDQRNQFDFYRDMPGGLSGLREVVHACQARGVRVYIDYNPWDRGTRREDRSDIDLLIDTVRDLDVDGIFLDTMTEGAAEFRAKLDAARAGVVLEGEGVPPLNRIADHHASWAQHFQDSPVPGVLRHKWLERRHMQHQIRRWSFDHTAELHTAWMNGSGMMVWENVFGSWVAWNERDRSILRTMLPIQRRFPELFSGESWTPLVPTEAAGVFASCWSGADVRLWTLVNREEQVVDGPLLKIQGTAGERYFDLISGDELRPEPRDSIVVLRGKMPRRGIGCFLATSSRSTADSLKPFLQTQRQASSRFRDDTSHPRRETRLIAPMAGPKAKSVPDGMVAVRPGPDTKLTIVMRMRECGYYDSMTDSEEGYWSSYNFQTREFQRLLEPRAYAIDETPVTNARFHEFVTRAQYRPRDDRNFLKHWDQGKPTAEQAEHPVVWVSLEDARAFAQWAGRRLPTEEEWQFAAQGGDGRAWPWGPNMEPGRCNDGSLKTTTPVRSYPDGRSPCGCLDLCGNVWQWTESERTDGRTRFCIIRGGSYFAAQGSNWYVDGGPRAANFATKFLLMWPGLDRCATIGFRCAVDLDA